MKKVFTFLLHSGFWMLAIVPVYIFDFLALSYFDFRTFTIFSVVTGTLINAVIFYTNSNYLLPKILVKQLTTLHYVIILLLLVSMLTCIEGFADFYFNKYSNAFWDNVQVTLSVEYFDLTLLINLLFLLLSFGYGFTVQWYKGEVLKRKLMQDKVETELSLLKAQINPHFLFNTLNNIFGIARKSENQNAANSVAKLAEMMRYLTYETKERKMSLEKEIKYIQSYIDLQKLRFSPDDDIEIKLDIEGSLTDKALEPMLLLPIVENAFKHGISLQKRSEILLRLKTDDNKIYFEARNTIAKNKYTAENSGEGLKNLRKRLALLYAGKHELNITENEMYYQLSLTIYTHD
ncbi:MAG TPA: hypothetical protein DCQ31_12035 [Bacteroidales bacterium]|nr:hypothetical protein [Bacteroidales bacterium]